MNKSTIWAAADECAAAARAAGLIARVTPWQSDHGFSAYVQLRDPLTGFGIEARFSDHPTGERRALLEAYGDVSDPTHVLNQLLTARTPENVDAHARKMAEYDRRCRVEKDAAQEARRASLAAIRQRLADGRPLKKHQQTRLEQWQRGELLDDGTLVS